MDDQLTENQIVALRERQDHLISVISAINELETNKDWLTLKELVFLPLVKTIEQNILNESLKPDIDTKKVYTFQGEMKWAKRYGNLISYAQDLIHELEGIKIKLR